MFIVFIAKIMYHMENIQGKNKSLVRQIRKGVEMK